MCGGVGVANRGICTILVVEDDPTIAEMLRIILEDDGCHIVTAGSGEEALRALEAGQPDLVTLDLNLPDMDGLNLLGRLGNAPVIILSARAYVPRDQGNIVAVLDKPFDATRLGDAVQRALGSLPRPGDARSAR